MRLLNTHTGRFEEKDLGEVDYAILSHTWEGEEQTFQQVQDIQEAYDDVDCLCVIALYIVLYVCLCDDYPSVLI